MKRARKKTHKTLTYESACEAAAKMDHWTVDDAAALLAHEIPPRLSLRKLNAAKAERIQRIAYLLSGAACVVNPESPIGRYRVAPREIVEWARQKSAVPSALVTAVLGGVREGEQAERHMRESTRRRERCRAVAALLWQQEQTKHLTLQAMAQRPELLEIGCEGRQYKSDTIADWIKEANPNRKPGRRPNGK